MTPVPIIRNSNPGEVIGRVVDTPAGLEVTLGEAGIARKDFTRIFGSCLFMPLRSERPPGSPEPAQDVLHRARIAAWNVTEAPPLPELAEEFRRLAVLAQHYGARNEPVPTHVLNRAFEVLGRHAIEVRS